MLMAAMAFSGAHEEAKRRNAFDALVARPLYEQMRLTRDERPFADPRMNAYLERISEPEASQLCRKVGKILGKRSEVGRMAAPWILELWMTNNPDLPRMTNNLLMDRVSNILGRSPEMWLKRVWLPARPVFHLFAAYFIAALILPAEVKDPFNPLSGPVRAPDTEITNVIAKLAMTFQERLIDDARYGFASSEIIWLDWR